MRAAIRFFLCGLNVSRMSAAVIDVTDFGADGTDSTDDTPAINSSIAALSATGTNVLYFPAGTYLINPQTVSRIATSYAWVNGDGYGSVLKRLGTGGNGTLLQLDGLLGVRVTHLRFDVNAANDADSAIAANNASDVLIQDCTFFSSGLYTNANARNAAVKADHCPALWIVRNRVSGLMIDATSPTGGGPGIFIKDNYLTSVPYCGIMYRAKGNSAIRSCEISGNIINGIRGSYGIQFGRLSSADNGTACNDIHVVENQILGPWRASATAIYGSTARQQNKGWIIARNIVHPDGKPRGTTSGIRIGASAQALLEDVQLSGNTIKNLAQPGISISGKFQDARIVGNHLGQTRGISVASEDTSRFARVLVEANVCIGSSNSGLWLGAVNGNLYAKVLGNTLSDSVGDASAGLSLETGDTRRLVADIFQNEFSDSKTTPSQWYGAKHSGSGIFDLRYFDNRFDNNQKAAVLNPPTDVVRRDNRGW